MLKRSFKGAMIFLVGTIIGMLVGWLIYIVISTSRPIAALTGLLQNPSNLLNSIRSGLQTNISSLPIVVLLATVFFAGAGFYEGIRISVGGIATGGGELGIEEEPKKEKKKKEKKAKEKKEKKEKKKKEKKEEEHIEPLNVGQEVSAAPEPEETFVDTGNRCQICGKPIPQGRAICKECEAALKSGTFPTTFNIQGQQGGGTEGTSQ